MAQQTPDAGTELTSRRVTHLADGRPGGAFLCGAYMHTDGKIHIIQNAALQDLQCAGTNSSAGWNTNLIRPFFTFRSAMVSSAAARSMELCASWPQV